MFKDVVRSLDLQMLPEIGLLAFFLAFVLILTRVVLLRREECDAAKHLPFDDEPFVLPHGD